MLRLMRRGAPGALCVGLLATLATLWPQQRPISLASLAGEAQSVVLDFRSDGCFHSNHYRLRYQPIPIPRLFITDLDPDQGVTVSGTQATAKPRPKELAMVELTPEQVKRLDNMLQYYRKHDRDGGCTTVETLTVSLYQAGQERRTERYQDGTCRSELLADADPRDLAALKIDGAPGLSIPAVVATALQATKRGATRVGYVTLPRDQTAAYREVGERRGEEQTDQLAKRMAEELDSYDALQREFRVEESTLGWINGLPYSLYLQLRALKPRLVDAAWWFNPAENERARYDWNQFLAVHRSVERAADAHPWLAAWKQAGPKRSVEAQIFALRPYTETDVARFATPAWKHATLKGMPGYQLLLRRDGRACATIYLGKEDERALILDVQPPIDEGNDGSRHWLDDLTVSYHPTQHMPDYMIVTPDHSWTRNTRRKQD